MYFDKVINGNEEVKAQVAFSLIARESEEYFNF